MKKRMALWLALICAVALTGCSAAQNEGAPASETEKWDRIPMVMVDGVLYLDTGHNSTGIRQCGTSDGEITSAVDSSQQPAENDQSNFGTGYGYQYGAAEGTIELYINEKWRIFATEEAREKIQFPDRYAESNPEPDSSTEIPGATTFIVDIWDRAAEEGITCAEAIEPFYQVGRTVYCFSCIKSQYVMVMDNTGRTVDIVTALNEGLATIADLDAFGIEYDTRPWIEFEEFYTVVPPFSYTQDRETYAEGDPGVTADGFVNTSETELHSVEDVVERAKQECTVSWDTVTTYFDISAGVWKVVFSTEGTLGGCQSVYLRDSGKTTLIVYGE